MVVRSSTSRLRSAGENGAREYEVLAPLVADDETARESILFGRRTDPTDLAGPMVMKHAARERDNFNELRERLMDEALDAARSVHPNLTSVADVIENDDGLYIVLEHVDGTDLSEITTMMRRRKQALSYELAAFICLELLKAMQHLHTSRDPRGTLTPQVIRDVTPFNVLVAHSGRVKLANKSLARALERKRQRSSAELFAYFAPECVAGEPFSIQSDIYGAGVILYELIVGKPCFSGASKELVIRDIVTAGVPLADLDRVQAPPRLKDIVEGATFLLPEKRFQSALEMARALERYLREVAPALDMAPLLARFLAGENVMLPSGAERPIAGTGVPLYSSLSGDLTLPAQTDSSTAAPLPDLANDLIGEVGLREMSSSEESYDELDAKSQWRHDTVVEPVLIPVIEGATASSDPIASATRAAPTWPNIPIEAAIEASAHATRSPPEMAPTPSLIPSARSVSLSQRDQAAIRARDVSISVEAPPAPPPAPAVVIELAPPLKVEVIAQPEHASPPPASNVDTKRNYIWIPIMFIVIASLISVLVILQERERNLDELHRSRDSKSQQAPKR